MELTLRQNCRFSLPVPTSMGLRVTPEAGQPVGSSDVLHLQAISAETNVASVASYLGLPVKVLTTFVKDSPFASFIKANLLRARGMDFEGPDVPQGGPWGYRHQINVADSGFGARGPRGWNDRAGEVGRTLDVEDFDPGLIAALSPETGNFCREIARVAKKYGTRISFDLNYRASFWLDRERELHDIFTEIRSIADILIGDDFECFRESIRPVAGDEFHDGGPRDQEMPRVLGSCGVQKHPAGQQKHLPYPDGPGGRSRTDCAYTWTPGVRRRQNRGRPHPEIRLQRKPVHPGSDAEQSRPPGQPGRSVPPDPRLFRRSFYDHLLSRTGPVMRRNRKCGLPVGKSGRNAPALPAGCPQGRMEPPAGGEEIYFISNPALGL